MKINHVEPYGALRAAAYPSVEDQLDALVKLAAALKAQIDLPPAVTAWIDACLAVKEKFPKR